MLYGSAFLINFQRVRHVRHNELIGLLGYRLPLAIYSQDVTRIVQHYNILICRANTVVNKLSTLGRYDAILCAVDDKEWAGYLMEELLHRPREFP